MFALGSGFRNYQTQIKLEFFAEWTCVRQTEELLIQSIQLQVLSVYGCIKAVPCST